MNANGKVNVLFDGDIKQTIPADWIVSDEASHKKFLKIEAETNPTVPLSCTQSHARALCPSPSPSQTYFFFPLSLTLLLRPFPSLLFPSLPSLPRSTTSNGIAAVTCPLAEAKPQEPSARNLRRLRALLERRYLGKFPVAFLHGSPLVNPPASPLHAHEPLLHTYEPLLYTYEPVYTQAQFHPDF